MENEVELLSRAEYLTLGQWLFEGFKKGNGFSKFHNWEQELLFKPGTEVLRQVKAGPCGVFSVLQGMIQLNRTRVECVEMSGEQILMASVLDISERIGGRFVFGYDYNDRKMEVKTVGFSTRQEALLYMNSSQFLRNKRCLMLLIIGFARQAMCQSWFPGQLGPMVSGKQTSMGLVYFLILGTLDPSVIDGLQMTSYASNLNSNLGIIVIENEDSRVNGCWLNPNAPFIICHQKNHFYLCQREGDRFRVFSNLGRTMKQIFIPATKLDSVAKG